MGADEDTASPRANIFTFIGPRYKIHAASDGLGVGKILQCG